MTEYRALLTDREREILRGRADVSRNYVYQIRNRVRGKLERLSVDIDILETHQPELFEELLEAIGIEG